MGQDYYSFEEALNELQIERDELERMVEEGDISAISEEGKIKFLRSEVENIKITKMDQPTISVLGRNDEIEVFDDEDDGFAGELKDDDFSGELKDDDFSGELQDDDFSGELQDDKEFKHGSDAMNPILSIESGLDDSQQTSENIQPHTEESSGILDTEKEVKPLLDIDSENDFLQDVSQDDFLEDDSDLNFDINDEKDGTDELKFEDEGLMETGELLEVKEKLPADEVEEALFGDSKINLDEEEFIEEEVSKDLEEIKEAYFKEEATKKSVPQANQPDFVAPKSSSSKFLKIAAGILAIIAAFGGVSYGLFVMKNDVDVKKEVVAYTVDYISVKKSYDFNGIALPKTQIFKAPKDGYITKLAAVKEKKTKNDVIAILYPVSLQTNIEQMEEKEFNAKEAKIKFKNMLKNRNTFLKKNPAVLKYMKNLKKYKKTGLQSYIKENQKIKENSLNLLKEYSVLFKKLKKQYLKAKALAKEFKSLKQKVNLQKNNNKTQIKLPKSGIIKEWNIDEGDIVKFDMVLCKYTIAKPLELQLYVPSEKVLQWSKNEKVKLKSNNKNIAGIIVDIKKTKDVYKLFIEIQDEAVKKGDKLELSYTKEIKVAAVPTKCIYDEGQQPYIFFIDNGKVVKRNVNLGQRANDFIQVKDLKIGSKVIYKKDPNIKVGDSVSIKKVKGEN